MKKYFLITLLLCSNVQIHSERPCLWISMITGGHVTSAIVGGLLGYYFPSPALGNGDNNATWAVGAVASAGIYVTGVCTISAAKACYDGVCCND